MHYDMEDLMEQANEVQESMSRTYGVPDEVDEADLEAGMSSDLAWSERSDLSWLTIIELDALGDDFEEEAGIPSYLREEGMELPDFVDAEPSTLERPVRQVSPTWRIANPLIVLVTHCRNRPWEWMRESFSLCDYCFVSTCTFVQYFPLYHSTVLSQFWRELIKRTTARSVDSQKAVDTIARQSPYSSDFPFLDQRCWKARLFSSLLFRSLPTLCAYLPPWSKSDPKQS